MEQVEVKIDDVVVHLNFLNIFIKNKINFFIFLKFLIKNNYLGHSI